MSPPFSPEVVLALALFEHVVAGLGEDEAASQSWLEVEPFLLSPSVRLTGQSKMSLGAEHLRSRVRVGTL